MSRTDMLIYLAFCLVMATVMVVYFRWGWKAAIYSDDIVSKERGRLAMNFAFFVGIASAACAGGTIYRLAAS